MTINFSPSTNIGPMANLGTIDTWRKINGQKVVIRNYGTWRNIKTTKPRFTGRVKWIGPLANLFHFYESRSYFPKGVEKNVLYNFFSMIFVENPLACILSTSKVYSIYQESPLNFL